MKAQDRMADRQDMKQKRDALRLLLQQHMALEDAALFEPNLDSMVRAGYVTAEMIQGSSRQVLEALGLSLAHITKLGRVFGVHGEPAAKPGLVLSLIECSMDAFCHSSNPPMSGSISFRAGRTPYAPATELQLIQFCSLLC